MSECGEVVVVVASVVVLESDGGDSLSVFASRHGKKQKL